MIRFRAVKHAVASLAILAAACFPAMGQTPDGDGPQASSADAAAGFELSRGEEAYRNASYDEAIAHFQKAAELAPGLLAAKSGLATALTQKLTESRLPGPDAPESRKIAERAIELFQEVLAEKPHDVDSMKRIAALEFSVKKWEAARAWQMKLLAENPKDAEAAYTVGVIDWMEAHQNVLDALAPAGMTDDGEGNAKAPAEAMKAIKAQNEALVEEGMRYLRQALANRPGYGDAMAYLNLMYRRKADLDWGNRAAREDDLAKAARWMHKAMRAYKASGKKRAGSDSSQS